MLCDSCYQLYVENSPRLVLRIPQHQHQISSPTHTLLGKIHPFGHTTLTNFIGNRLAVWGHDLGHLTNTKLDTSIGCGGYYLMERNTSNRYLDIIPSQYVRIFGMYMNRWNRWHKMLLWSCKTKTTRCEFSFLEELQISKSRVCLK